MLISLAEYAAAHKKDASLIRAMCGQGRFKSAKKIGRNWVIDSEEPYLPKPDDKRIKSGKYIGFRKKYKQQ